MTYELSNEEKAGVVSQHLKSLEYSIYNIELSKIEENAVAVPNTGNIASLNEQLVPLNAKRSALIAELEQLTPQE